MSDKVTSTEPSQTQPKEEVKSSNPTLPESKERAVNPMAIRPEGVAVTIKQPDRAVDLMGKLFGF